MITLDGMTLTPADVAWVAAGDVDVRLAPAALARVAASAAQAQAVAAARPVYGRSTGVGANRTVALPPGDADAALALLRSHATSAGPLRAPGRVRAALVVRLNQLLAGGSGASVAAVEALAALLRSGALPPVRELGSVGTADLTVFATTALTLVGELAPTSGTALPPVVLGLADALPLLSSNAAAIADAAVAVTSLDALAAHALTVAAGTFVAVSGNAEAFSVPVETVTPFPGAQRVCQTMRALIGDGEPARIQDPFALRTLPQVHGPLLDALVAAADVVTRLAGAPAENPVFLPPGGVAHHGGFHAAYLTQTVDAVRVALVGSARLSLARLALLCDPAMTGLPAFLGDGRPGASGVLALEYVAGSALGSLQALATPAGLSTVSLSRGVEEDASFASVAAREALDTVPLYRTVLAAELVAAARAARMRGLALPGAVAALTSDLHPLEDGDPATADRDLTPADRDLTPADRDLTPELARAERALKSDIPGIEGAER